MLVNYYFKSYSGPFAHFLTMVIHVILVGYRRNFKESSDWLRAGRSGDQIPVGRDFPPVQTGPGAHPASCIMGIGLFPGVKHGRGVLTTTYHLLVPRSWKSRAVPLPTVWATTGPVTVTLQSVCWRKLCVSKNRNVVKILFNSVQFFSCYWLTCF